MFEELDLPKGLGEDVSGVVMSRNRKDLDLLLVGVVIQKIDSMIDVLGSLT